MGDVIEYTIGQVFERLLVKKVDRLKRVTGHVEYRYATVKSINKPWITIAGEAIPRRTKTVANVFIANIIPEAEWGYYDKKK